MEQVHNDNIEYLATEGLVIHGRSARRRRINPPAPLPAIKDVTKFTTSFFSEDQIKPVIDELISREVQRPRRQASPSPPTASRS